MMKTLVLLVITLSIMIGLIVIQSIRLDILSIQVVENQAQIDELKNSAEWGNED